MAILVSMTLLAAVNLCLGYALAVYLGHGPPSLKAAWDALSAEGPDVATADDDPGAVEVVGAEPTAVTDSNPPVDLGQPFRHVEP